MFSQSMLQRLLFYTILVIFCSQLMATGVLYVRPRSSNNPYQKVWIKSLDINVTIQDQVAETKVDQIFFNELNSSVEAIYIFPLPENAVISGLVYWVNGVQYEAEIRERQDAVNAYNQKLRQWLDPALLEYLGNNLFRLSIVPVNAQSDFRTEITYTELIKYDFGVSSFKYLMNTLNLSSQPLETVHLKLEARSQNAYRYFYSPSHENSAAMMITRHDDYHCSLEYGDEDFFPDKDFRLQFETTREDVEFSLLTYTPTPADSFGTDSYYALWITPPDSVKDEEAIKKDIVFTADVSSSMQGERISQLKQSLHSFLDNLRSSDRFNIITFSTNIVAFKNDLYTATPAIISEAHEFVDDLYALGLTNISDALDSSLSQSFGDSSSRNLVFLTDGKPTIGITFPESIIQRVKNNNINDVRIFSFGIGEQSDRSFLTKLSIENHGYATFINADDSIAILIGNHFKRISKPVMIDLSSDYKGLDVKDQYPKELPDLYWGTQLLELGLYTGSGEYPVELSGWMGQDSVAYSKSVYFGNEPGGYRFVPRLWAQAKINHLLDMIKIHGELEELVNQIIELSLTYQIVTPYTALYVDPTDLSDIPGDKTKVVPNEFQLFSNYPNPFNPETTIKYTLPSEMSLYKVTVKVYDTLGRLVQVLVDESQGPGLYSIKWNGKNTAGLDVPSGTYFCIIHAGHFQASQKLLLVR